jgi:hypothetical protein
MPLINGHEAVFLGFITEYSHLAIALCLIAGHINNVVRLYQNNIDTCCQPYDLAEAAFSR